MSREEEGVYESFQERMPPILPQERAGSDIVGREDDVGSTSGKELVATPRFEEIACKKRPEGIYG